MAFNLIFVIREIWDDFGPRTRAQREVLTALARCADVEGLCYPGIPRIARDTIMGATSVREAIDALIADGWLHVVPRNGRTHLYGICVPDLEARKLLPPVDSTRRSRTPPPPSSRNREPLRHSEPHPSAARRGTPPPGGAEVSQEDTHKEVREEISAVLDQRVREDRISSHTRDESRSQEQAPPPTDRSPIADPAVASQVLAQFVAIGTMPTSGTTTRHVPRPSYQPAPMEAAPSRQAPTQPSSKPIGASPSSPRQPVRNTTPIVDLQLQPDPNVPHPPDGETWDDLARRLSDNGNSYAAGVLAHHEKGRVITASQRSALLTIHNRMAGVFDATATGAGALPDDLQYVADRWLGSRRARNMPAGAPPDVSLLAKYWAKCVAVANHAKPDADGWKPSVRVIAAMGIKHYLREKQGRADGVEDKGHPFAWLASTDRVSEQYPLPKRSEVEKPTETAKPAAVAAPTEARDTNGNRAKEGLAGQMEGIRGAIAAMKATGNAMRPAPRPSVNA